MEVASPVDISVRQRLLQRLNLVEFMEVASPVADISGRQLENWRL